MAEQIKDLIEKIQQEGIKVAQDKAKAIEEEARQKAQEIIEQANSQAQQLIAQAKQEQAKTLERTDASLKQAGRDLLLAVRKEINAMLDRIIARRASEALSPQEISRIISALIKGYSGKDKEDIVISLNKQDLDKLGSGFLNELKEEVKKGVVLKASEDIYAGFTISYDAGKSHFEFTDKALAEYIGSFLKPQLRRILLPEA